MNHFDMNVAFWNYDRTRALADGSVGVQGVKSKFHSAQIVTEIFENMIRKRAYDVSELGMTYFLRAWEVDPMFLAIPVFPNRAFRHSAIYINKASGISRPEDLAGKVIGELALYGHDAGVMAKGILSDEYGVKPEMCRWVIGGIDFPLKTIDFVPQHHPDNVAVTWADSKEDLGDKLVTGEIQALISADVPKCILDKSPTVAHLFTDYELAEREYFKRTGIFPIMHTIVVRRELAENHPDVVRAIYAGFCAAKEAAAEQLVTGMTFNNMGMMIPWITKRIEENREALGADWWPYGMSANRKAVDAILRYHYEQGLTKRRIAVEDIFVTYLLHT